MYKANLFGRFTFQLPCGTTIEKFATIKVFELLTYLLCHPANPHHRDKLSTLLWRDLDESRAKRNLRKTLWQLQQAIGQAAPLLDIEPEWVRVCESADLWLDTAQLEAAFALCRNTKGAALTPDQAATVQAALQACCDELLVGCYSDWCILRREQLTFIHLVLLDKMVQYCERNALYSAGIDYGNRILAHDCARERTHRALMRLHYLAGDRSSALRQHQRCVDALQTELGVQPAQRTTRLYATIVADNWEIDRPIPTTIPHVLIQLKQMRSHLTAVQQTLDTHINAIEGSLA